MARRPPLPLRWCLLVLALGLAACSAPGDGEDTEAISLAATTPKLIASKWAKLWANLPADHSGKAHYAACAGEDFRFTLRFRNKGSAIWRDVLGRGNKVGSDVFLETANNKTDALAGKKRFSIRWNLNDWVRGDRKAKECTVKRGCRRTRFVRDGIPATAPKKLGVFRSRWRLRDYSKTWNKPQGFGPKVEMRVRVVQCRPPDECPCKITCGDGASGVIYNGSEGECSFDSEYFCVPYEVTSHQWFPCSSSSGGSGGTGGGSGGTGGASSGSGGTVGGPNAEEPPEGPGYWITDSDDPTAGSGGSGGSSGAAGASGTPADEWWNDDDDPGIGTDDVPDDPDYEPDGFDGVAEDVHSGVEPIDDSGCALSAAHPRSSNLALLGFVVLATALRRRARAR